ncbi:MAG TPA: hypothetical protein VMC06_07445 [Opitutaceae bacterium]|nr:hypothetical protein [Opitutaceae bacterium]
MKTTGAIILSLAVLAPAGRGADDLLDRVDEALSGSYLQDAIRVRLSGALDLEGYRFSLPAPGLILTEQRDLFNPRLSLFLDAQMGSHVYAFVVARGDRGFDPGDDATQVRLDEYALRLTPGKNGRVGLQLGKFATVVGNWTQRHSSWDNPFVTAPLPYENLTGIWDAAAVRSGRMLLNWAGVQPPPSQGGALLDKYKSVPIIWGPSYTSGAALFGRSEHFDYAVEIKNAALSSRPEVWDAAQTQWQHPSFSGRLGYRPNFNWNLGFSASTGSYLQPLAAPTLAAGSSLDDYRETVLGQDIGFAWHEFQFWSEVYRARFEIPRVGFADTTAYYLEAKLKFTPQFFGAVRWNQQLFGTVRDSYGSSVPWSRDVWRIDLGLGYRFTAHTQFKVQYSWQHEDADLRASRGMAAVQFTARF